MSDLEGLDQCTEIQGLLPWLVNDTLAEERAETVRAHVASCPACRENLSQLESDWRCAASRPTSAQLVEFVFGASAETAVDAAGPPGPGLDAETRQVLSDLAEVDPAVRREIAALRASRDQMERAPADISVERPRVDHSRGWWGAPGAVAAAALLIAATFGGLWLQQRGDLQGLETVVDELSRPRANAVAADVLPDSSLERSRPSSSVSGLAPVAFRLDADQDLTLILSYPQADPRREYAVRLKGPDGLLWEFEGLAPSPTSDFTVTFPPGFLAPGTYRMEIYLPQNAADPQGVLRLERRYVFDISPP